jgi:hypothetical protein
MFGTCNETKNVVANGKTKWQQQEPIRAFIPHDNLFDNELIIIDPVKASTHGITKYSNHQNQSIKLQKRRQVHLQRPIPVLLHIWTHRPD